MGLSLKQVNFCLCGSQPSSFRKLWWLFHTCVSQSNAESDIESTHALKLEADRSALRSPDRRLVCNQGVWESLISFSANCEIVFRDAEHA